MTSGAPVNASYAPRTPSCMARASGQRALRSNRSARSISATTERGSPFVHVAIDRAGCVALFTNCSFPVAPSWTWLPLINVNIVAPTAHRSVRPSTSSHFASACSGAMNAGVPITVPTRVSVPPVRASWMTRAIPKSSTLSPPVRTRNRFSGLMSRWTTPLACALARTSSTAAPMASTSATSSRCPFRCQ